MYRNYNYYGSGRDNGRIPATQQQQIQAAFAQLKQELIAWQQEANRLEKEVVQLKTAVSQQKRQLEQERLAVQQEILKREQKIESLQQLLVTQDEHVDAQNWEEKYNQLKREQEVNKARLEQRYAREANMAKEQLLLDMLPVADNLERALTHVANEEERAGIELTLKAFTAILNKYGVQQIDATERPFDPNLHEAISVERISEKPAGAIVAVTENGYTINNKLLRPSRVIVNSD